MKGPMSFNFENFNKSLSVLAAALEEVNKKTPSKDQLIDHVQSMLADGEVLLLSGTTPSFNDGDPCRFYFTINLISLPPDQAVFEVRDGSLVDVRDLYEEAPEPECSLDYLMYNDSDYFEDIPGVKHIKEHPILDLFEALEMVPMYLENNFNYEKMALVRNGILKQENYGD